MGPDNSLVRKIRLTTVSGIVYRFKLFFNGSEVPCKNECKRREDDSIVVLEHVVYLANGLWQALEKRVQELVPGNNQLSSAGELGLVENEHRRKPDYESVKRIVEEYVSTSQALLGIALSSRHVFPESRVVYLDSENNMLRHSGFIEKVEELR